MLEQKINEFFGDDEPGGFGTGWWSGVLSAFFGLLAFGAVVCLHFPQLLSSPELRPHYSMPVIRMLIQVVIVGAIVLGCVAIAVVAGYQGVLRRGPVRAVGLVLALAGLAAAVIVLVSRDTAGTLILIVLAIASVACRPP